MNRIIIIAAIVCLLADPVSASELNLLSTHLAITLPDSCSVNPKTNEQECSDWNGLYMTFHFHMEPGKNAHEQDFLTQFNLERIAHSGRAERYKRAFERDRARPEMHDDLLGGGVVDPTPLIGLNQVGGSVWAFIGIWGATTSTNVPLLVEKLEIWDAGRRVILDFVILNADAAVQALVNVDKSLRFVP